MTIHSMRMIELFVMRSINEPHEQIARRVGAIGAQFVYFRHTKQTYRCHSVAIRSQKYTNKVSSLVALKRFKLQERRRCRNLTIGGISES